MTNQERYKMNFIVVLAWKLDELLVRIKEDSHSRNSITTWMFNKSTGSPVATSKIYAVDAMLEAHRNREGNKPGFRSGENCMEEEGASQDYSQDNQEMGTRGPLENSPHIYHNSNSPRDTGMQEWFPSWLIKCSKRQCAGQSSHTGSTQRWERKAIFRLGTVTLLDPWNFSLNNFWDVTRIMIIETLPLKKPFLI